MWKKTKVGAKVFLRNQMGRRREPFANPQSGQTTPVATIGSFGLWSAVADDWVEPGGRWMDGSVPGRGKVFLSNA